MNGILRKLTLGDLRKPSKPPRGMVLDGRSKEAWSKDGGGLITNICFSASNHISAEALIEKMNYKTEIH